MDIVSEHANGMPDNLASRKREIARLTGAAISRLSGTLPSMPKKPPGPLQIAISARLQAVQEELDLKDAQMAELVGIGRAGRTRWANWINRHNMPEEQAMITLCEKKRVSMEWLYRGIGDLMPAKLFIRLELRIQGIDPETATHEQVGPVAARVTASVSS